LRARVRIGKHRCRVSGEQFRIGTKRHVGTRNFAIEVAAEIGRPRAEDHAQSFALGVAHFAEPAVLQRAEHSQQHQQPRRCRE
jgi:hypothetical protein